LKRIFLAALYFSDGIDAPFIGVSMLVVTRKKNEKLLIGDNIEIIVLEVGRNSVRLGMKAPQDVAIQTRLNASPPAEPAPGVIPFTRLNSKGRVS
jgi:hypothetical protein